MCMTTNGFGWLQKDSHKSWTENLTTTAQLKDQVVQYTNLATTDLSLFQQKAYDFYIPST